MSKKLFLLFTAVTISLIIKDLQSIKNIYARRKDQYNTIENEYIILILGNIISDLNLIRCKKSSGKNWKTNILKAVPEEDKIIAGYAMGTISINLGILEKERINTSLRILAKYGGLIHKNKGDTDKFKAFNYSQSIIKYIRWDVNSFKF